MTSTNSRPARGSATRSRKAVAATAAGALILGLGGAFVAATSAQADTTVTSGSFDWGFRESFRTYVGNQTGAFPPIGAAPENERITVIAPATFDADGTPSVAGKDYTKPYTFPVTGEAVNTPTDLNVETDGGVVYNFPSHAFTVTLQDPQIVVSGATKQIVADINVVVPENTAGQTPGTYGGENVAIADIAAVNAVIAGDGESATITGSGLTLTAAGATALNDFLTEGATLDNFSATVALEDPAAPATPTVTVDKTVANPAGDVITVTGTGFDTSTTLGTRPPLSGQPAGTYVVFGTFRSPWQPSLGSTTAPSANRKVSTQRWAVPAASVATIDPSSSGVGVVLDPDGSFTTTLQVQRNFTGALADGNYGIYTYPGSGAVNAAFETYTPITWEAPAASAPGTPGTVNPGDEIDVQASGFDAGELVDVVLHSTPTVIDTLTADSSGEVSGPVTIPAGTELGSHQLYLEGQTSGVEVLVASFEVGDPDLTAYQTITTEVVPTGALTISVADNDVTLPVPELSDDAASLETSGALNEITVADLRSADPGWTLTGTLTDFTGTAGTFDGDLLKWTPVVNSFGTGQVVTPGAVASGLTAGKTIASALAGQGRGTAKVGAGLELTLPTTTDPGEYVATLTLTAV